MLRHKRSHVFLHSFQQLIRLHALHDGLQRREMDHLEDPGLRRIKGQEAGRVHEIVPDHPADFAFRDDIHAVDTGVLDRPGRLFIDGCSLFHHQLARLGIDDILRRLMVAESGGDRQLLIIFIPAHPHQVVPFGVEEQAGEQVRRAFQAGGFAGLLPFVDLNESFFPALCVVALLDGRRQPGVIAHHGENLLVRSQA